ncbi:MAG: GNAT family N-acetyltransferase [Desulfomonile tiedjei]|uniref:GNAT family N-acetyltransferase n=1 Tax=Desulfomonile tiedjei TaxID=2358 RepID=A0A9D6V074_9BACT|nr:GNAT family N-acetyltransferase [Desulfomonile tiedjei]
MPKMKHEQIGPLTTIDEFSELLGLQKEVWGLAAADVVPVHTFKAVSSFMGPKGTVLGYFLDGKIAGYVLTFPTSNPKEVHVDMIGVSKNHQHKGIGSKLLLALRTIMLQHDVDTISWTFDPLESVNANLYIAKLGGIVTRHFTDFYGSVSSPLHSGLPTDRFRVEWHIRTQLVQERIERQIEKTDIFSTPNCAISACVEIPLNIQDLRNGNIKEALEWRMKTREQFDDLVEKKNLVGIDFTYDPINQKGLYVFQEKCNE